MEGELSLDFQEKMKGGRRKREERGRYDITVIENMHRCPLWMIEERIKCRWI